MKTQDYTKLKALTVDELIMVRDRADSLIRERFQTEKQLLKAKLACIEKFETGLERAAPRTAKSVGARKPGKLQRTKVAAKYRDPSSGQTWAGRGLQPRWMREALKSGANMEDFLIVA